MTGPGPIPDIDLSMPANAVLTIMKEIATGLHTCDYQGDLRSVSFDVVFPVCADGRPMICVHIDTDDHRRRIMLHLDAATVAALIGRLELAAARARGEGGHGG